MKIFTSIYNFLKQGGISPSPERYPQKEDRSSADSQDDNIRNPVESEPGLEFLDGMSTGTARFIIDREISPDLLEKYNIEDLENKGRYYLAKIVNKDGEVTDTVLIDKLNRSIHFQKAKLK